MYAYMHIHEKIIAKKEALKSLWIYFNSFNYDSIFSTFQLPKLVQKENYEKQTVFLHQTVASTFINCTDTNSIQYEQTASRYNMEYTQSRLNNMNEAWNRHFKNQWILLIILILVFCVGWLNKSVTFAGSQWWWYAHVLSEHHS